MLKVCHSELYSELDSESEKEEEYAMVLVSRETNCLPDLASNFVSSSRQTFTTIARQRVPFSRMSVFTRTLALIQVRS